MNRPTGVASHTLTLGTIALFSLVAACTLSKGGDASTTDASYWGTDVSVRKADVIVPSNADLDANSGPNSDAFDLEPTDSAADSTVSDVGSVSDAGARVSDAGSPRDLIASIITSIDKDEIQQAIMDLEAMSRPNRATGTANYRRATEWAKAMVEAKAPGAEVRFVESGNLRNIEISLKGTDPTAGMYIIGGHLDSVPAGPGMDDDGSGSVATLFIAMAMSRYQFKSEVRFLLFDAEERGWLGSTAYARMLRPTCPPGSCLKLYVNLDMLGNDPDNRTAVAVTTTNSQLRMLHTRINTEHALGVKLEFGGSSCGDSDDCSFQRQDYATVEDKEADFSPNWHTARDTAANMNFDSMTKNAQLVAGVVATLAGIEGPRP